MAGPWEAFQDSAAQSLAQNDATIVAPPRAPVAPSNRVWGDAEAQNAGLYENPNPSGPWEAFKRPSVDITFRPGGTTPVQNRFGEMQPPATGGADLQRGLDQRGLELNRGTEVSPAAQMAMGHENALVAASQRTTPDVSQYGGNLVSTQAFEDDAGNVHYIDPETKKLKPVEAKSQVVIRDPADGTVKVFNRSDATNESGFSGLARVATGGMLAGAPTARAALSSTANVVPKASETFAAAKPFYRAFKNEAGKIEIPPETGQGMAAQLRRALDGANLIPELAQPIYSAVGILEKGEPMTLDVLQNVKRVVGRGFSSPDKNVRDAAAVASKEITKIIGQVSQEAGQSLKTADAIHSTARAQREIQQKGDIADLRTGRAGYGGNAVNSMRQVLSPIVQKSIEGKVTGFQPGEIAAIREIVEGTGTTNFLRQVGAMAPSKGVMQIALGGATGGVSAAVGSAANKLATILTSKQIDRLNELVAKRSPAYAQAVAKAADRFEKAQIEFANNPAPNKFAAYISASRALAGGLSRDGIPVTSGELLKSIQGPVKSAAEGDQQPIPGRPGE